MSCQRKEILGIKTIINVINHPLLRNLPFILETPNEANGYAAEIKFLRSVYIELNDNHT